MALGICGIVAVAFAASGLLTWQVMHHDARQLQDIRTESMIPILKETRQLAGWQGLYASVDQISNPTFPDAPVIAILDPEGTVIAGDPLPFDPPRGWSFARDAEPPETAYRVIRTDLAQTIPDRGHPDRVSRSGDGVPDQVDGLGRRRGPHRRALRRRMDRRPYPQPADGAAERSGSERGGRSVRPPLPDGT